MMRCTMDGTCAGCTKCDDGGKDRIAKEQGSCQDDSGGP